MSKLKLTEQQLTRLNRAYYETELAGIKLKELMTEKQRVFEEIQKETQSNFQTWNAGTGETDFDLSGEAIEVIPPPRKRKK
jgi:hypothetical protein